MSITGLAFLIAATSFAGELAVLPGPKITLAVGYHMVGRELERVERGHVFVAGDRVVAWTAVAGVPSGFIEHVWSRDGVEVARQVLPVGSNRRWRSWSRHTVKPGSYEVRIIGPDGRLLGRTRFEVAELEEDC
jgi:hypothetical protein